MSILRRRLSGPAARVARKREVTGLSQVIIAGDPFDIASELSASIDGFNALVENEGAMLTTIRGLQDMLRRLGFDPGTSDGIPGSKTQTALSNALSTFRLPAMTGGVTFISSLKSLGGLTAQTWLITNATKIADAMLYYRESYLPSKTAAKAKNAMVEMPEEDLLIGTQKPSPFEKVKIVFNDMVASPYFWPGVGLSAVALFVIFKRVRR